MYVHQVVFTITGCPASTRRALTAILLGFNDDSAGRMAAFAHLAGFRRSTSAASCPRFRALAAAAVGFRTKASGRRMVRRVPARASRRFRYVRQLCRHCHVRGHAPARRAARSARP